MNYVHKTSLTPHESRFELIDTFPKILSNNKKLARDIHLDKFQGRQDFVKSIGISRDILTTKQNIDKSYFLVEKRVKGVVSFGQSFSNN